MAWMKLPSGGLVNLDQVAMIDHALLYAVGEKRRVFCHVPDLPMSLTLGIFPSKDEALAFIDKLSVTVTVLDVLDQSLHSPDIDTERSSP